MLNSYFPHLKTTVSELRAFRYLGEDVLDNITPVFELTKANKSKNDRQGDIHKRLKDIQDVFGSRRFYLDLTVEDKLSNDHIDSLFEEQDGYKNWINFFSEIKSEYGFNAVPFLLMHEDSDKEELLQQAQGLLEIANVNEVAVRVELDYIEFDDLLGEISGLSKKLGKRVTVFFDFKYVGASNIDKKMEVFSSKIKPFFDEVMGCKFVVLSGSFPVSIYEAFGSEKHGDFPLKERELYEWVKSNYFCSLGYGDYALIYPKRNEKKAYNWTPRIDFPTAEKCFFYREKREEGGYASCAYYFAQSKVFRDFYIKCWGCEEVESASLGSPNGKSPSYWISVRSNIHMTRLGRSVSMAL
ncbi:MULTISPECIES: beta family protein [Chromohalobacter]|uniref:beta family protein n=1 Tax=Chromohalobacter TaxID=42054 RepID=UPI001FFDDDB4|nr:MULTISPECIES: beta family protein [Chromohalobacter]MCK2045616.1 beta family protein [Chromohalobacter moromii]MCT8468311.1 beta family protein [Chromohalobacter canadensis]MCT8498819.1 beta family protein [Chromohalobacter canadensis]